MCDMTVMSGVVPAGATFFFAQHPLAHVGFGEVGSYRKFEQNPPLLRVRCREAYKACAVYLNQELAYKRHSFVVRYFHEKVTRI